jgi:hypothetical protein
MLSRIVGPVTIEMEVVMTASTHTLDPVPSVDWRIADIRKTRRPATVGDGSVESAADQEGARDRERESPAAQRSAHHGHSVFRSRRRWIRAGAGGIAQSGLFVLTLATIGWLHVELLALVW